MVTSQSLLVEIAKYAVTRAHLLHDARFPFAKRGVPPEFVADVFHLDFDAT